MPAPATAPDEQSLHLWRHHWQDEWDAAYLYMALAGQEPDPGKATIYRQLADVERRHTDMWAKLLTDNGHPPPAVSKPSAQAVVMAWLGRRFGARYLLPLLLRAEGREVKGYMDLYARSRAADARDVSLTLARESASHAETLASLAGLTTREPWELIVVDNNSTDATPLVVAAAAARFPVPLRYIFEREQGRCAALNAGIRAARGEVIVTTDDDVRVEPNWLDTARDALGGLDCDYVGGKVLPVWSGTRPPWLPNRRRPQAPRWT